MSPMQIEEVLVPPPKEAEAVVVKVRAEFDIPRIREGAEDEVYTGYEFEQLVVGYNSSNNNWEEYIASKQGKPKIDLWKCFELSVKEAIDKDNTNKGLAERYPIVFAPYLFNEVFANLDVPQRQKANLRMYAVVNTPFDYEYGTDLVFVFDRSVCTIDLTISPQEKKKLARTGHFVFTNYQLSQRQTTAFAKKIAEALIKDRQHLVLPKEVRTSIQKHARHHKRYKRPKP